MPDRFRGLAARTLARLAVLALGLLAGARAAGAQDALDIPSFVASLDALALAARGTDSNEVADLRARVPGRWVVADGDQRYEVEAGWITERLDRAARAPEEWPAWQKAIVARLELMRAEAAAVGAEATTDRHAAGEALERVLAQPEFQRSVASVWLSALRARVARAIVNLWERLGGGSLGTAGAARVLAWIVGIAALASLTVWLIGSLSRASGRRALGLAPPASRRRSSRAWAARAAEADAAGDPREAARCAYHAALARLEEEGAWQQDETRTPREYLRLLPPSHGRRAVLADVTVRFERAWYGTAPAVADDARSLLGHLRELGCLASDRAI